MASSTAAMARCSRRGGSGKTRESNLIEVEPDAVCGSVADRLAQPPEIRESDHVIEIPGLPWIPYVIHGKVIRNDRTIELRRNKATCTIPGVNLRNDELTAADHYLIWRQYLAPSHGADPPFNNSLVPDTHCDLLYVSVGFEDNRPAGTLRK